MKIKLILSLFFVFGYFSMGTYVYQNRLHSLVKALLPEITKSLSHGQTMNAYKKVESLKLLGFLSITMQLGNRTGSEAENYFTSLFPIEIEKNTLGYIKDSPSFKSLTVFIFSLNYLTTIFFALYILLLFSMIYPLASYKNSIKNFILFNKNAGTPNLMELSRDSVTDEIQQILNANVSKELTIAGFKQQSIDKEMFTEMAQQVAHDIRSPLSALNVLVYQSKEINIEKKEILNNISNKINKIANDLLNYDKANADSKIISTPASKEENVEDVSRLLQDIVNEKIIEYSDFKDVEIRLEIDASFNKALRVDSTQLQRAISNLINNSIESLQNNSGHVIVSLNSISNEVQISILDNGCGIDQENLAKIGDKGFTEGKNTSTSGSGLGLYFVSNMVKKFNGKFSIFSKKNQGTLINLSFPAVG